MDHYYRVQRGPGRELFKFAMPGFQASIVKSSYIGETLFEHFEPNHRILVTLDGRTAITIAEAEGAATVNRPDRAGSVTIVPAGTSRKVLLKDGSLALLSMAIAPDFVSEPGAKTDVALVQNGRDDWLWRASTAFQGAAATGGVSLEYEGLALAVARHLRRRNRMSRRAPSGLDPAALRRVLALMNDRVTENLSLSELAAECGLSLSAFSRSFRQSAGMPPHRYFNAIRMARAEEMLRQKHVPLAVIAGAVGYSDQAHFTAAFSRSRGISPARWRASLA